MKREAELHKKAFPSWSLGTREKSQRRGSKTALSDVQRWHFYLQFLIPKQLRCKRG
jgi:hypothetical protein